MLTERKHTLILIILLVSLPVFALLHLNSGQIDLGIGTMIDSMFSFNNENMNEVIAREIRIPRMLTALLVGGSLSIGGLLMQTLFRNPLAGPYVLGINSGSSLFVAFTIMTGVTFFQSDLGMIINALIGAFLFGLLILFFAGMVRNQISLLLVGIMLGSFTSAFISILETMSHAEELKVYMLWSLGSLQKVEFHQLGIISLIVFLGLIGALLISKQLNLLVLGEREAKSLGLNIKRIRYLIIGITALLTGVITAFCGPIAFVGLAVPNMVRILFKTQHHIVLITASFLLGAIFVMSVDAILQLLESWMVIPINAITSIIGAPIVVIIVFRRLR